MINYSLPNRSERYEFELLTPNLAPLRRLDGVKSCSLDWSIHNTIRGGGNLSVVTPETVPWQQVLVRARIVVSNSSGEETTPLITAYARIPDELVTPYGREVSVELHDRTLLLDEWKLSSTYSVAANTVVTDAVREVFRRLGITRFSITDSPRAARTAMVWDPASSDEISWLRVLNDMLESIGYAGVYPDALGHFRCDPYSAPGERVSSWRLTDEHTSGTGQRYAGGVTVRSSVFESFNEWVFYSRSTGDAPPMVARAVNADPRHPYSTAATGRTRTDRRTDVDATTPNALALQVAKAKAEAMANQRTFTIAARYVPTVEHEVLDLVSTAADITTRASVSARSLECSPGSKLNLTLREV